jgi:multiple sugar transport system ATP-binding protein
MAHVAIENVYKTFPRSRQRSESRQDLHDKPSSTADQEASTVLKRINLFVEDGEFMVLVGPSGCGKSTLLRLISGLESITGGNVYVGNQRVNDLPPKQRDTAMVFQSYALYPHLTVYDNLAFGLRRMARTVQEDEALQISQAKAESPVTPDSQDTDPNRELERVLIASPWWEKLLVSTTRRLPPGLRFVSDAERMVDDRVRAVAKMLQIGPLLSRYPRQLSGGQKQRVALGRAMARNPQVFLMDEPLSNLDAKLRLETRAQIVNLQRQLAITTIYVTHDQVEAMTMGHRIAVMNQGQIQQVATPLELYNRPANRFVAEFIGSPAMNFIPVEAQVPSLVSHPEFRLALPSEWDAYLKPHEGRELLLGVRPEHFSLALPAPKNIRGTVCHVEALGSETYLTVQTESLKLTAKVPPDESVSIGDEVWLAISPEKAHLFDPAAGNSLLTSEPH